MEIPSDYVRNLYKVTFVLLIVLSAFFAVKLLGEMKRVDAIGGAEVHTITLSGHGEVTAVPDIASVSFGIEATAGTQSEASEAVNTKVASVLAFLRSAGIEERDIRTENYSSYPKYSNPEICPMYYPEGGARIMPPCRPGNAEIVGFTVSQSMTVKIRKVDDASKVIDGINQIGVSNMYGPNFTIDDEEILQAEARKEAIADARKKAESLADDLDVRLGKVVSFSEGGFGGPIYYAKDAMLESGTSSAPRPAELPQGENTIYSDVTITFEIR